MPHGVRSVTGIIPGWSTRPTLPGSQRHNGFLASAEMAVDVVERLFEYRWVTAAPTPESIQDRPRTPDGQRIQDLQRRVHRMQGAGISRPLPSLAGLSSVLTLRTGAAYGVDSASLALALLAGPSQAGEWVALVGAADLGLEAAAGFGVDLSRTVVVPHPGEHWLSVTAGLVDVATVILVKPPLAVTEHQAERIRARLRQKDATLLCWGSWPRCEARLSLRSSAWTGLGRGHGRLQGRRVVVDVLRGNRPGRSVPLWLPGVGLDVSAAGAPVIALDRAAG